MTVYLISAISADGFIAPVGDPNSTTWMSESYRSWFEQRTKDIGVVIMSFTTYSVLREPLSDRLNIVLTTTGTAEENIPDEDEDDTQLVFSRKDPNALITELNQKRYPEAAIYGGSSIFTQFLNAGLIDQMQLGIESRIFGRGVGLFADRITRNIALSSVQQLSSDVVLHTYNVT